MRDVRRRRRVRHRIVAAGVVVVVLGAGGTAYALRPADSRYRTATVTTGDVEQHVALSATVASAGRADATFATDGTVASVAVQAGDEVEPGDVLASLDADELADAVDAAQEEVTTAQETLADDLEAQASGTSTTSVATSASGSGGTGVSSAVGGDVLLVAATSDGPRAVTVPASSTGGLGDLAQAVVDARADLADAQDDVRDAQDALLTAYDTVEDALAAGTTALDASGTAVTDATGDDGACASVLAADGSQDDGSQDDGAADLAACVAAIVAAQDALVSTGDAQSTTGVAESALVDLVADLDDAVATLDKRADALDTAVVALADAQTSDDGASSGSKGSSSGSAGGSGAQGSGSTGSGSTGSGSEGASGSAGAAQLPGDRTGSGTDSTGSAPSGGGSGSSSSGGSGTGAGGTSGANGSGSGSLGGDGTSSGTVTAERILADRAAVTVAQSGLEIAQAAAESGTLTAPIAGTVAEVDLSDGSSVTAGSTDTAVTILGDDGYVLSTTLDLAEVRSVAVGQSVTATVPATGDEYSGTVSSIGVLDASESSTPSYAATVALDPTDAELPEGASASATVSVATVDGVLVVPSSAVAADGSTRTVRVLDGDAVRTVEVTTGAVGPAVTEITDGLTEGDEVVLADLDQQLVSDDDQESGLTGLGSDSQDVRQGGGSFPGGFPQGGPGGGQGGGQSGSVRGSRG